jgi:hypothetical protein
MPIPIRKQKANNIHANDIFGNTFSEIIRKRAVDAHCVASPVQQ